VIIVNVLLQQRACEHAIGQRSYMESLQCLGALSEHVITEDICYPSREAIQDQINGVLDGQHQIRHVYIATDDVIAYDRLQLVFNDQVCL